MSEKDLPNLPNVYSYMRTFDTFAEKEFALYAQFRSITGRIQRRQHAEEYIKGGKWVKITHKPITIPHSEYSGLKPVRIGLQEISYRLLDKTIVKPQLLINPAIHDPLEPDEQTVRAHGLHINEHDEAIAFAGLSEVLKSDIDSLVVNQGTYAKWLNLAADAQLHACDIGRDQA